jgi:hypothetical protein
MFTNDYPAPVIGAFFSFQVFFNTGRRVIIYKLEIKIVVEVGWKHGFEHSFHASLYAVFLCVEYTAMLCMDY